MKFFLLCSLFFAAILGQTCLAEGGGDDDIEKGDIVALNPTKDAKKIHCAQASAGFFEVQEREAQMLKILTEDGKAALDAYLQEKEGAVVLGPGGVYWIVDGNHHTLALKRLQKKFPDKFGDFTIYSKVKKDYSNLTRRQFERAMKKKRGKFKRPYVRLKDENGKKISFDQLPKDPLKLKDDHYRSVAWMVQKAGAIEPIPGYRFQQFDTADYLRKKTEAPTHWTDRTYLAVTDQSLEILHDADDTKVPGLVDYKRKKCAKMLGKAAQALFENLPGK